MSDHTINYDLRYPGNGVLECHAAPDAMCHAVFDCECESYDGYHVVDGKPHHHSSYDGIEASGHHVGHFDPDQCNLRDWHENSDEDVAGEVRVYVKEEWSSDYVKFHATSAEVTKP